MIGELISKLFICRCRDQHPIRNIKQLEGNRVVGKCLNCNKRVYGQVLFDESRIKEFDALFPADKNNFKRSASSVQKASEVKDEN